MSSSKEKHVCKKRKKKKRVPDHTETRLVAKNSVMSLLAKQATQGKSVPKSPAYQSRKKTGGGFELPLTDLIKMICTTMEAERYYKTERKCRIKSASSAPSLLVPLNLS